MSDCIFCKIANGEIPSATIYEDEDFRVILDIFPASKGHALIIPKQHARNLYEISEEQMGKAAVLAKRIGMKMKEVLNFDGLNIVQNNDLAAGQTVFHFHFHLIPRYDDDDVKIEWPAKEITDEDREYLVKALAEK
jgi:Diadenosine tetraphosphate (Ap4A) hydrolase and other HIT family hydrolases